MADSHHMLNSMTPLAYLPPAAAVQWQTSVYVILGSAGAFLMDWISSVDSDYQLLFNDKIAFPTLVYFFSRATVLVNVVANLVFRTAPLGLEACKDFQIASCITYHLSFASTTLLFYLRIRAVFNRNRFVSGFFLFLWVAVMAGTLTVAFYGGAWTMGPTKYCVGVPVQPYLAASPIIIAVNDTCVFLAISWRLLQTSYPPRGNETTSTKIKNFLLGRDLPTFSKALFQEGQVYYLISVISNILAVYTVTAPSIPSNYRFMYVLNCVIANMMATRVFRHTKFGIFKEDVISTSVINSQGRVGQNGTDSKRNSLVEGPQAAGYTGGNRPVVRRGESDVLERLSPGLLIGSIIFVMILIPAVCIYICMHKKHLKPIMK